MNWHFFGTFFNFLKSFSPKIIKIFIIGALFYSSDSQAENSVECHPAQIFEKHTSDAAVPVNSALLCSFVEEGQYIYGANVLEITEVLAKAAQFTVETTCKNRELHFDRYLSGIAYGGIENFTVETVKREGPISNTFELILKITGTFYCVPSDIIQYCLPDHCS